ncbi:MAG: ArsR/SmtB family transcription factor [Acidiferrobacterales bacterium]
MDKSSAVDALCALAHETRLDVFRLLLQKGIEGASAGQIAAKLRLPSATLSFHLNALKSAQLVSARRQSRSIIYSANFASMNKLLAYLLENCCRDVANERGELVTLGAAKRR